MQAPRGQKWVILGVAVGVLATAWAYVVQRGAGPSGSVTSSCVNNLNILAKAMELYTMDWNGRLPVLHTESQRAPEGRGWTDLLMPYLRKMESSSGQPSASDEKRCREDLVCPGSSRDRLTYAFNRRLSGRKLADLYDSEDDSDPGRNIVLLYETLNDSPPNNNLNGDSIWTPGDGPPKSGVLPLWNRGSMTSFWRLPKWARSRHKGDPIVACVDGRVKPVVGGSKPRFEPKAQEETKP